MDLPLFWANMSEYNGHTSQRDMLIGAPGRGKCRLVTRGGKSKTSKQSSLFCGGRRIVINEHNWISEYAKFLRVIKIQLSVSLDFEYSWTKWETGHRESDMRESSNQRAVTHIDSSRKHGKSNGRKSEHHMYDSVRSNARELQ